MSTFRGTKSTRAKLNKSEMLTEPRSLSSVEKEITEKEILLTQVNRELRSK